MDWGFLLLRPDAAKAASMPAKLAEFFAAGVRPIHYGCNDEVGAWVRRGASGLSLSSVDGRCLDEAAAYIAADGPPPDAATPPGPRPPADHVLATLEAARARTEAHFSIVSGATRYAQLFDAVLARQAAPRTRGPRRGSEATTPA